MATTTNTRNSRTRTPKTVSVAELEQVLRSISKRSFSDSAQSERQFIRNRIRSLYVPSENA